MRVHVILTLHRYFKHGSIFNTKISVPGMVFISDSRTFYILLCHSFMFTGGQIDNLCHLLGCDGLHNADVVIRNIVLG